MIIVTDGGGRDVNSDIWWQWRLWRTHGRTHASFIALITWEDENTASISFYRAYILSVPFSWGERGFRSNEIYRSCIKTEHFLTCFDTQGSCYRLLDQTIHWLVFEPFWRLVIKRRVLAYMCILKANQIFVFYPFFATDVGRPMYANYLEGFTWRQSIPIK